MSAQSETASTAAGASNAENSRISVIQRTFAILNCFTSETPTLTLSQISQRTGLAPSTTSRMLAELREVKALERDAEKRYSIGPGLMEIAQSARPMLTIRETASPILDDLSNMTHLHIQLGSRDGDEMVVLDRRNGKQRLPVFYHIGDRLPLVPTATGRVLLAYADPAVVERVLDGGNFIWPTFDSPRPPVEVILASLEQIRRTQVIALEPPGAPVSSVAAPIRGRTGAVIAAVGIVVKTGTMPLPRLTQLVKAAATGITRQLAGPAPQRVLPAWGVEPGDAGPNGEPWADVGRHPPHT